MYITARNFYLNIKTIGETARRIHERIKDHNGSGHKPHMLEHSIEKHHDNVAEENIKIKRILKITNGDEHPG